MQVTHQPKGSCWIPPLARAAAAAMCASAGERLLEVFPLPLTSSEHVTQSMSARRQVRQLKHAKCDNLNTSLIYLISIADCICRLYMQTIACTRLYCLCLFIQCTMMDPVVSHYWTLLQAVSDMFDNDGKCSVMMCNVPCPSLSETENSAAARACPSLCLFHPDSGPVELRREHQNLELGEARP